MKKALLAFLLLAASALPAQWVVNHHFSVSGYGYRTSVSRVDNSIVVSGNFVGPYQQPDSNDMGGFVMKYDAAGNLQWQKVFYSTAAAIITLNATDSQGNVFVSGYFSGNMQFENNMFNGGGMFLLKYAPDGTLLFSNQEQRARAYTICIDPSNNIYLTGIFNTDADTIFHGQAFKHDTFIAKYDPNGNFIWVKDFFCYPTIENAFDMYVDEQENIYTTGTFSQYGDLSFTDSVQLVNTGGFDGFVAKYNSNIELQWVKTITGSTNEIPKNIYVNAIGNIYIGGYYDNYSVSSTTFFDTIAIAKGSNGENGADIFIAKYTPDGHCLWVRTANGDGNDYVRGIYVDNNENAFITGHFGSFGDSIVFGEQTFHCPHGQIALFLAQYDANGNLLEVKASQGGQGQANDITGNGQNELYITGGFAGNWNFDGLALTGNQDMFLMKLNYTSVVTGTGIVTKKPMEAMQVFPNPTSGMLRLVYSSDVQSTIQLTITNTLGVKVYSEQITQPQKELVRDIDLGKAPKGIYTIEIIADRKREVRKVLLN